MKIFQQISVLVLVAATSCQAFVPTTPSKMDTTALAATRREMLTASVFGAIALAAPSAGLALDMDAFASSQIESDTKNCDPKKDPKCIPKLSADEALCKYGQSGNARGEACRRVKAAGGDLPSAKPQGKSLGGAYAM